MMHSVSIMLVEMREMMRVRTCYFVAHFVFISTYTLRYQENDLATFNISCAVKFLTLSLISDHKELPTLGSNEKKKGKF